MKKILFKDLEKGKSFLLNGLYAIKVSESKVHFTKLGVNGFIEFNDSDELEIEETEDYSNGV